MDSKQNIHPYKSYCLAILCALCLFATSAYADIQDFTLFTLDIPEGYVAKETEITKNIGYAVQVFPVSSESQEQETSLTLIYDSLHEQSFEDLFIKYKDLYQPLQIEQESSTGAYTMHILHKTTRGQAFLFNEGNAYSLYLVMGEDPLLTNTANSLIWK